MSAPQTLPSRLIGALFVERGLVSESQIRVALEIQRETGQQLGQILVERFGVSRKELASVVAEQWAKLGGSAGPEDTASWRRLGEIFVERGFVSQEELDQALARQHQTGERLGEALVAQGVISKFELAGALAEQMAVLGDPAVEPATPSEPAEATVHQLHTRDDETEEASPATNVVEFVSAKSDVGTAAPSVPETTTDPVEPPVELVEAPVELVEASVEAVETPVEVEVEAPVEAVEAPVELVEASAELVETPVDMVGASVEAVEAPVELVVEAPVEAVEAPVGLVEASAELVEASVEAFETPVEVEVEAPVELAEPSVEAVEVVEAPVEEVGEPQPAEVLLTDLHEALAAEVAYAGEFASEDAPLAACLAFAPTTEGYRLVALDALPEPGETIDVPEVGERVVLRIGRSPIPADDRLCAFVEEPVTAPVMLAVH